MGSTWNVEVLICYYLLLTSVNYFSFVKVTLNFKMK